MRGDGVHGIAHSKYNVGFYYDNRLIYNATFFISNFFMYVAINCFLFAFIPSVACVQRIRTQHNIDFKHKIICT